MAAPSAVALALATPASGDTCRTRLDIMEPWMTTGEFYRLSDDREGKALLGARCETEEITDWFAQHGWTLATENRREPMQLGPPGHEYWSDIGLNYCLPASGFWSWFGRECDWMAHIIMYENHITHVSAGPTE